MDSITPYFSSLLFVLTGTISGFIDSIAGGGGLINLPALTLALGPGPVAIGTNKIAGVTGALVAFLVYLRGGHMDFKKGFAFASWVGLGSIGGSWVAQALPLYFFKLFLFLSCPLILWVVWNKNLWVKQELLETSSFIEPKQVALAHFRVFLVGIACGFYDGVWGPGGGTFMFLALLFFVRLPLLSALAASKLANTFSGGMALVSYQMGGYVHWKEGLLVALGIAFGSFFGARHATQNASKIVRPVLVVVVILLLLKLIF